MVSQEWYFFTVVKGSLYLGFNREQSEWGKGGVCTEYLDLDFLLPSQFQQLKYTGYVEG